MALTCPICGITINEGIEICPKCHARIMPPVEKAARQSSPAPPKKHPEIEVPKTRGNADEAGVPPTVHATEQSDPQSREKTVRTDVSQKQAQTPQPSAKKERAPQAAPAPPQGPETATVSSGAGQASGVVDVQQPGASSSQAVSPEDHAHGTQGDGPDGEPEAQKEPCGMGGGTPPGGTFPGWPYSYPFGFYAPFQSGPCPSHGSYDRGGATGETFTMGGGQQLLPVPGYNIAPPVMPFFPGWPYPQLMLMPATCYPFPGVYPQGYGYCYPTQYPPRQQYAGSYDTTRKKGANAGVIALIVILIAAVLGGGAFGIWYLLSSGNSDINLGSASVPGENIELQNLTLIQKEGSAVLTGTYDNQGSRDGELVISVSGTGDGAEQVLSYRVPVKAETADSFNVSQSTQLKFKSAALGSILFRRSSSSDYNNDSDGGSYPWQDGDSDSDDSDYDSGSTSTTPDNSSDSSDSTDKDPWEK